MAGNRRSCGFGGCRCSIRPCRRNASQPRALQDEAVRIKSPLCQIVVLEQEQFKCVSSRTDRTDRSQDHHGKIERRSAPHATLKEAFDDAESEYKKSIASDRWVPHNPA